MSKKIFTREVKVGILAAVAIFVLYFGLNFLKGIDIFSPVNYYFTRYENIGGLVPSSPVYIKGLKVGQVEEIKYDFSKRIPFIVKISVSKDISLPKDAKIQLYDEGLMGGKAIQLVFKPFMANETVFSPGDTLASEVSTGLINQIAGTLVPKIENVATHADSLLVSANSLLKGKQINNSLSSIERTTSDLAVSSAQLKKLLSNDVPHIVTNINDLTTDFKQVSGNLRKVDFEATFASINHTISNLNLLTDKMNSTDGSLGALINDKQLYINLNNTVNDADKLLIDLKANPKRYVNISVFGRKN